MSTAVNHMKRSHRSQTAHYNTARILRRTNEARRISPVFGAKHRVSARPRDSK